jgi:hypothetical protein
LAKRDSKNRLEANTRETSPPFHSAGRGRSPSNVRLVERRSPPPRSDRPHTPLASRRAPESSPRSGGRAGLDSLGRLAAGSPLLPTVRPDSREVRENMCRKVGIDSKELKIPGVKFSLERKFAKRVDPTKALRELAPVSQVSSTYRDVFDVYRRRFSAILGNIKGRSKEETALKKLCEDLNISFTRAKDPELAELFGRLRASDMVEGPV